MGRGIRPFMLGIALVGGVLGFARTGHAKGTPEVASVTEADSPGGSGYVLVVTGSNMQKVTAFDLKKTDGTAIATLTRRLVTKNLAALDLPTALAPPTYSLPGTYSLVFTHSAGQISVNVRITMGAVESPVVDSDSLDPALRTDLDDALTLQGLTPSQLRDASALTGTVGTAQFSAYADLGDESKIGTGSTQVAAGNHNHNTAYIQKSGGDTVSGKLTITSTTECVSATSTTTSTTAGALDATANSGAAVTGHGNIGVLGDLDSDGTFGVYGKCMAASQVGVYGYAYDSSSIAVKGYNWEFGVAVAGKGFSGVGVYGYDVGSYGIGVKASASGYRGTPFLANLQDSSSLDLAVFQYYGSNVARISWDGTGHFNGGVYAYGADFAEVVKVDGGKSVCEAGDVLVIDPQADRGFRLSSAADSPLVAGVYSTKPGLIGVPRGVAGDEFVRKDEVPLAVTGIVPVKVCDEGGAIRPGDALVTSSMPGRAKKAGRDPPRGSILGKALGRLEKGTGVVEVLLGPGR